MDQLRKESGEKLLQAAHEFWKACRLEGQYGAVQWLQGSDGELIIFTRGEYRQQLLAGVNGMDGNKVHYFHGETMPREEEE